VAPVLHSIHTKAGKAEHQIKKGCESGSHPKRPEGEGRAAESKVKIFTLKNNTPGGRGGKEKRRGVFLGLN
jgi:hypothetical protein